MKKCCIIADMKKILFVLFILFNFAGQAFAAPHKIISLNPVGTEILFALGQGNKVAGVTTYCDYPQEAKKKPKIGDYFNGTNIESLIANGIDLVVISDLQDSLIPRLKRLGINYAVIRQANITEVYNSIRVVGKLCNVQQKADELVRGIQNNLNYIKRKTAKYPKTTAVICVSRELSEPRIHSFYAAGDKTFYSELLEIAGGKNLVKSRSTNYQRISAEGLLVLNPNVIFDIVGDKTSYHSNMGKIDPDKLFDKKNLKNQWESSTCVTASKHGNIFILDGTLYLRPGLRMAEIALVFAKKLHPAAFTK